MRTLLFAGPACVVIACGLAIADAARAGTVPNTVAAGPGNGTASPLSFLNIYVYSLDGTSRNVSCTGTSGWYGGYIPPVYSTKTFVSSTSGQGTTTTWWPADFGGNSDGLIPGSINFSVTCNLPPQTAINFTEAIFPYPVGS